MRYYLVGLVSFSIVVVVSAGVCPDGWLHNGGSCYAFIDSEPEGWIEAMFYCSTVKAKLVEVESVSENNFLKKHLQEIGTTANYWIGLSDIINEGHYIWQTTQDNVDFSDWATGEPNDLGHTEDCAEFYHPVSFQWNDAPCSTKSNFICEKSSTSVPDVIG
ncbi:perlucin-like [Ostrea edulis]|uniref:perlucin-like n=1 Tax=Ostrea edulis TaxID=37623 RepID=UPI002094F020|nr:perlucin-like [Ostrea edulis]